MTLSSQTADGFVIAATPRGNQVGDACSTLGYTQLDDRSVGSAATLTGGPRLVTGKWPVAALAANLALIHQRGDTRRR